MTRRYSSNTQALSLGFSSPGRWLNRHQPEWLERLRLGAPLSIGPTAELALAISGIWQPGSVVVQLSTRIDEAGTHGSAGYMTMAGYTARLGQWNRFDHKWKKALRKAGLEYFHVKEHGDHPFALKAQKIADDTLMVGFVVRLDNADYQEYYRTGGWGGKAQPDSMYGLCFRFCLSLALDIALQEIRQDGLTLNFIVEDGHPNCGAPAEIVRQIKQKRISGVSEYLGVAVTGEKKRIWGLQAADGLASGAWHLEALGLPTLGPPEKPSLARGRSVTHGLGCKVPIFRCHIDEDELTAFKKGTFEHIEYRRQHWLKNRRATSGDPLPDGKKQPS